MMLRRSLLFAAHLAAAPRRRFHSLGISNALVEKLRTMGIATPSDAQRRAIPLLLSTANRSDADKTNDTDADADAANDHPPPRDVVIAAETGGGKTLAYLIPLLERLQRHPLPLDAIHRPVALVLTTSQELVGQVHAVLAALDADAVRVTTALSSTQQQLPSRACAMLIATPKALLRATKPSDFAFTQLLVVDEADMLLGGGFERDTKQILATIRNQPLQLAQLNTADRVHARDMDPAPLRRDELADDTRQTVFTYATIPDYGKRSVRDFIDYKFPNAVFAVTDDFQRTLPRLEMVIHRVEDHVDPNDADADVDLERTRQKLLLQILADARPDHNQDQDRDDASSSRNTLVFTNSIESADALHAFLTTHARATNQEDNAGQRDEILLYHKAIPRETRCEILARLQQQQQLPHNTTDSTTRLVVVCTDIAARGLDTTSVGHVVQYEFATDVVSYIHRIGRTARAGTTGKVSSIVSEQNALVLSKIHAAGSDALDGAFSRKRSLRKKVKKLRRETEAAAAAATQSE